MKIKDYSIYLLYIAVSTLFIMTAALIQMTFVYKAYTPRLFVIPLIVGVLLGLLIAKIRILQKEQKDTLRAIEAKDEEILELNDSLEKKVEAKTHELSKQRLYTESILNAQNSIVIITDGYAMVKANSTFFRYFDDFTSMEEFQKLHGCICDLFTPKAGYLQPEMDDSRWATHVLNHPDESHRAFICFHDHCYYFSVHAKKFIYGNTQKIIVTFEDITTLVEYEEQLQQKIDEQIEANRKKDAIIHEQSRFTAIGEVIQSVSHHWRQPLSALSLLIQDIKEAKAFNELNEAYLNTFTEKSMAIMHDLSDTLDSFKYIFSDSVKDNKEFDVEQAVERALSIIKPNIKALDIQVSLNLKHPRVILEASQNEYIQAVLSILTNAVDILAQKEGERRILMTVDKDASGRSILSIFNNGEPIAEENMDKIFDPYFSTKYEKNGTGLGLFVTKSILEKRMGGTVTALNLPGGVEFLITV